jgi:hypothetical protein
LGLGLFILEEEGAFHLRNFQIAVVVGENPQLTHVRYAKHGLVKEKEESLREESLKMVGLT